MKENSLSVHVRDTLAIAKHKLQTLNMEIDKLDSENLCLKERIAAEAEVSKHVVA